MKTVLILGAGGRFGRHAAEAFATAGWSVRRLIRPGGAPAADGIVADPFDGVALTRAAAGADLIVNALNPAYPDWARDVPRLTCAVIAAATAHDLPVLIPANVYPYGADMPPVLRTETPHRARTRKGRIRIAMEQAYREAGVRTILLRAGDFLDTRTSGNWFESHVAAKPGTVRYPGPLDIPHEWAFLPDLARAAVALASRDDLPRFADIPFAGYGVTGAELVAALERATGQPQRVKPFPWLALRAMALVSPLMREVLEMRYLWQVPHRIDPAETARWLPDFEPTPLVEALRQGPQGQSTSTQMSRWSETSTSSAPSVPGAGQNTPASSTSSVASGST
ncbi:epimerase [Roseobacter sp. HKCCA0434]|uniref:epimerase n=1 Tax=Roseobacter sp. HKCCA0434 TaxID=3079297 RepID=UPI00396701A8